MKRLLALALAALTFTCAAAYPETMEEIGSQLINAGEYTVRQEGKKYVALTYDDGPHPALTNTMLDMLGANRAKATFFMLGYRAEKMKDLVRRVSAEGHEVGNHTYSHAVMSKISPDMVKNEIQRTSDTLFGITGKYPAVMRPPYGIITPAVKKYALESNMAIALWSIDTRDWQNTDADYIAKKVIAEAQDGDIILMHEIWPSSVRASESIIRELHEQGFEFITLSDLIHMNAGMTYGAIYRSGRKAQQQ